MTRRLFFALNATDPLAKSFLPTLKKLKINADRRDYNIRWAPVENFHITVSFLGNMPEESIPQLLEVLRKTCEDFHSFQLKIEDMGAFTNELDARVLWLGVQNKRYLGEFKAALDSALTEAGLLLKPDERDFVPHLTIARLRNPKSVKDLISPFKRKSFGKLNVSEIVLYESLLTGGNTIYKPIARCDLQRSEVTPDADTLTDYIA